jgi:hypothetical protein
VVEIEWPLPARLIEPHPRIESARGCVAIERGPLVFCVEQADHQGSTLADLEIDAGAPLASTWEPDRLGGVVTVRASGSEVDTGSWAGHLYRDAGSAPAPSRRRVPLTAIPYYAWANREPGAMRVWIPRGPVA